MDNFNLNDYEEIETTIGELKEDDLVYGTDNEWHSIKLLPIQNKDLYIVNTSAGGVVCSWDHQWNLYDTNYKGTYSTIELFNVLDGFKDMSVGEVGGPNLVSIERLQDNECRCIEVNSEDYQFEVLTDKGERVFTHNCQGRVVCGRVDTTASLMALGNTLGTAIDGSIKGRGIVSANGIMSNCQIYFDNPSWIDNWYADHGLDPLGYPPEGLDEQEILLGDDEEEITIDENMMEMDFEGIHKEVNNAKKQEFDNV